MAKLNPLKLDAEEITTSKQAMAALKAMGHDLTAEEAVVRYARRALALFKDRARVKAGKAARVYTARNVKPLPKKIQKDMLKLQADLTPPAPVKKAHAA